MYLLNIYIYIYSVHKYNCTTKFSFNSLSLENIYMRLADYKYLKLKVFLDSGWLQIKMSASAGAIKAGMGIS